MKIPDNVICFRKILPSLELPYDSIVIVYDEDGDYTVWYYNTLNHTFSVVYWFKDFKDARRKFDEVVSRHQMIP